MKTRTTVRRVKKQTHTNAKTTKAGAAQLFGPIRDAATRGLHLQRHVIRGGRDALVLELVVLWGGEAAGTAAAARLLPAPAARGLPAQHDAQQLRHSQEGDARDADGGDGERLEDFVLGAQLGDLVADAGAHGVQGGQLALHLRSLDGGVGFALAAEHIRAGADAGACPGRGFKLPRGGVGGEEELRDTAAAEVRDFVGRREKTVLRKIGVRVLGQQKLQHRHQHAH
mmetsp:Transcript_16503/g.29426  ORF Transcript_16503/g.29426 Transcript_16503/m.29426 type:complete len:227 (+) Transcript_16503:136-816(+)